MNYRLGLDLGTNSLGWCVLSLDDAGRPVGIPKRGLGVRIFSDGRDPQSKTSLAVDRRIARGSRRRRDRYLRRRAALLNKIVALGLMPQDKTARKALEALDPYELRARAISGPLTPHELGRALFHLHQRRGFQSNRKSDPKDEAGKIKAAISALRSAMEEAGARTIGEYLNARHSRREWVRSRLIGAGAKAAYAFYPDRSMVAAEFDAIQESQAAHHPRLRPEDWQVLKDIMFRQRPLKPVDPGRCTLFPEEKRASWALSIAQQFRILSELANLRIRQVGKPSRPLSPAERSTLFKELCRKSELKFAKMRRLLGLSDDIDFNLEDMKRDRLKGDLTASSLGKKARLGDKWHALSEAEQTGVVTQLVDGEGEAVLSTWLQGSLGIDSQLAQEIIGVSLADGYCRLSVKALRLLVPKMVDEGLDYAAACAAAGLHHSDFRDGVIEDQLPYYGVALERFVAFGTGRSEDEEEKRIGRVTNPTVHIGLNQVRKVVNEIIDRFGHPHEVVIELARELKQSAEKRQEIQREQADNQKKRQRREKTLRDLGIAPSGDNLAKLRLWEELSDDPMRRRCVYTGEVISIERLLSGDVDLDHILPYSRTLDDSFNNRILCVRAANRIKRGQPPFEAFGSNPQGFSWSDILERAQELPASKRWRFGPDAMDRYREEADFLARQLTDTQYLSRLARLYLSRVCHPDRVRSSPGRLTAMLRGKWGLNSLLSDSNQKNRTDHRHHAIDAAVVATVDVSLIKHVQSAAGRAEQLDIDRLFVDLDMPWGSYRDDLGERLRETVVSHKPDHGWQTKLHNDTAYGLATKRPDGSVEAISRKPVSSIKDTEIGSIRDAKARATLSDHIQAAVSAGKTEADGRAEFEAATGTRRLRLLTVLGDPIHIRSRAGTAYKVVKGDSNYCYEIYETTNGKWTGKVVSSFDAAKLNGSPIALPPDARLLMRLHQNDLVWIPDKPRGQTMRVVKFSDGTIVLAAHFEGGNLKARDADKSDPFKYVARSPEGLRKAGARLARVTPAGVVHIQGATDV